MTDPRIGAGSPLGAIVERYGADPNYLLQILREVQEQQGWISPDAISTLEAAMDVPRTKIEAVAGFYSFLYTEPVGKYRVLFSDNITDRMLGNMALLDRMAAHFGIKRGEVSQDGLVSIDTTSCTGMCDQGPAMLVNTRAISRLTAERIDQICELIRKEVPVDHWPCGFFQVTDNIRRADVLLKDGFKPGEAIAAALALGSDGMLEQIKASNLRGRGGAGFHTGLKWELCRKAAGTDHYVVCNADEGEPGTFKDRVLLTSCADQVFEGMTICASVINARRGFLYLRGEYRYLLEPLNAVLARRRTQGLLGKAIQGKQGFDFDIEIHLGAGAYVCGEESALIESLEGKRGTPRNRPPFPVTSGYLNQPTVVNNVETLLKTCMIARKGGEWYAKLGTPKSTGTKLLSISGDCDRPGIYEYEFGVTVAQVLADCGAYNVQAVQISGAAGVCIAPDEFERKIAFEDIPTAGSFMVFNNSRDMFEVARNFTHFFAHESCGFCTPCRVGTSLLVNMMDKLEAGKGSPADFMEIKDLNKHLFKLSHCGLGHSACNPVLETIAKFRPAYERRLVHKNFVPAFDLDGALAPARRLTQRDDAAAHFGEEHE
ncbi:NAD(P)H-dependent oxidoreductase subunit E [Noviherbaspirillum sp. ST9]|uniref:NAD(P)H-dependent oxidoreductase subunit E n=1 Tax=Noviherbaspirillum sp. ST9 TaxID=3401606 RepID=UPI003B586150